MHTKEGEPSPLAFLSWEQKWTKTSSFVACVDLLEKKERPYMRAVFSNRHKTLDVPRNGPFLYQ